MSADQLSHVVGHLEHQFLGGTPVLFTGAGFSTGLLDSQGRPLPSARELAEEIWKLVFPDDPFDAESTLQDVFHVALQRKREALQEFLLSRFSVRPDSIPEFYRTYFSMPWYRAYTLNIDNLEQALGVKYVLPFRSVSVSARRPLAPISDSSGGPCIEVVHLNGSLHDAPEAITFSTLQYASRAGVADPYYESLSAELLARPIVFVGTRLDEQALWQHVEMRSLRQRGGARELRCKSYIVTKSLTRARQELLRDFNVTWLPMTAEEFAVSVLEPVRLRIESAAGQAARLRHRKEVRSSPELRLVGDEAAQDPNKKTNYLIGQEPEWADLLSGRAIVRDIDGQILKAVEAAITNDDAASMFMITGTAASGKSTGLMRVALALSNRGAPVVWYGRESDASVFEVIRMFGVSQAARVIAIDDLGRLGDAVLPALQGLLNAKKGAVVIGAFRAGGRTAAIRRALGETIGVTQFEMPHLSDPDIDALIEVLTTNNRLGRLLGWPPDKQRKAFREQANRQLLVAMIQATSGKRFSEKIEEEYNELPDVDKLVYGITAVATGRGYALTQQELLLATGDLTTDTLAAIERLVSQGILTERPTDGIALLSARHREIAAVLTAAFSERGLLWQLVRALVFAVASCSPRVDTRTVRANRLLKTFLSHEYMARIMTADQGRGVYEACEKALALDYQYWLQRGAFELDVEQYDAAKLFLEHAASLRPDDPLVRTECHHLQLKIALRDPKNPRAAHAVEEALDALEELVRSGEATGPHPYHLLGSQGLAWINRTSIPPEERQSTLRRLKDVVDRGFERHPLSEELASLSQALSRELLRTHTDGTQQPR